MGKMRFSSRLVSVVVLAFAHGVRSQEACPAGFAGHGDGCYTLSEAEGSFVQCQREICAQLGGSLAVIHDDSLNAFLAKMVSDAKKLAYIGIYETGWDESGEWVWVDGSNTSNSTLGWTYGEPNNWCLDEDCAYFDVEVAGSSPVAPNGWHDIECSTRLSCLCQKGGTTSEDFLEWEANRTNISLSTAHYNFSNFSLTMAENYAHCFVRRERCWWYNNSNFELSYFGMALLSGIFLIYSLLGCLGLVPEDARLQADTARHALDPDMGQSSFYGQLLEPSERNGDVDKAVDSWVNRGAWGAMLYAVCQFTLAATMMMHINYGVSFGFWVDGIQAMMMFTFKFSVAISAFMVHRHLSQLSRSVAGWWVLLLAFSKLFMAISDLVLGIMYISESLEGFLSSGGWSTEAGSFCMSGYIFSWTLVSSMVFQSLSGLSFSRMQARTVAYMGRKGSFSNVIGASWWLLVIGTFVAGIGLGICASLLIFDNEHDQFDPLQAISFCYSIAGISQFVAGAALLRANSQVRGHFKSARTIAGTEMVGNIG
ncbi:unnamed protein product [Polarella glacialis]|nr:unnamed protein product [Polarella glacialis]